MTAVPLPPGYVRATIPAPLPSKLNLEDNVKEQIRLLTKRSLFKDVLSILGDYSVIFLLFALGIYFQNAWSWLVLGILMATRQHGLLILMHEATHGRILTNNYWNVRLSNFLFSWPFILDSLGYRNIHLKHHRYLYTEDDPDIAGIQRTYAGQFPKTRLGMVWLIIREFLIGYLLTIKYLIDTNLNGGPAGKMNKPEKSVEQLLREEGEKKKMQKRGDPNEVGCTMQEFLSYYALLFVFLTLTQTWSIFFWLWVFPMSSWLQVILRLRFVAEHFGVSKKDALNLTRNTLSHPLEGYLLTPHNVNYHIVHHLYPNLPSYNLPKVHKLLCEASEEYRKNAHTSYSILGVIDECTLKGQEEAAKKVD